MMKKMAIAMSLLLMLCLTVGYASAEVYATLNQPIATRTGPGTNYVEVGGFLRRGDVVLVRTKVWDPVNEIWWVQVEFEHDEPNYTGDKIRAYTGAWRMNVDLSQVPEETQLRQCRVTEYSDAFTGPWYMGFREWPYSVFEGTSATLYEVEDGFAHIECWNGYLQQMWRAWIPLQNIDCAYLYDYDHYWGSADDNPSNNYAQPDPTRSPSTYYGSTGSGYPVGEWCQVIASSAHVRSGPGMQYPTVGYVKDYQWYEILECTTGSTGKDWYKIKVDGVYGWLSSGLVVLQD